MKPETMAMTSVQGRVLTRHAAQRDGQLVLQYYLATAKGPVLVEVLHGEYLCFCQQTDVAMLQLQMPGQALRYVPLALKSFSGSLISGIYTPSSQAYRTLVRIAKDAGIALFEADIRPEQRFLIERFVALDVAFLGHFAQDSESTEPAAVCGTIGYLPSADEVSVADVTAASSTV
ncbi:MAG: DNA polymerase II, partial [Shewanella sp.]